MKGLFGAVAEGPVALAMGPFDAIGEDPGFAAGLLAAMGDVPKAFGFFAKGLLGASGEPVPLGSASLLAGLLAAKGEAPMPFVAASFAKGLLAASGEEPAALEATPVAAPGLPALVAGEAALASSRSDVRVAAGLFVEETSPLPAAVPAAVAVPAAFLAGAAADAAGPALVVAFDADAPRVS